MQRTTIQICASVLTVAALFSSINIQAQYEFSTLTEITHTSVKDQCMTGTCWSYSTSSFFESEAARITGHVVDLSEMATVRYTYPLKAEKYIRYHGNYQFSPGSLCHDVTNAAMSWGLCPQEAFTDSRTERRSIITKSDKRLLTVNDILKSREKGMLDVNWRTQIENILNDKLGELPQSFMYSGRKFTPAEFRDYLGIVPDNYLNLTSFTHHPFGEQFILEVPDNFSQGAFFNVPIDVLQRSVEAAVVNGYSVAWDADVSEKGFSFKHGMAILPQEGEMDKLWTEVVAEQEVTQASRQEGFETKPQLTITYAHCRSCYRPKRRKVLHYQNSWGTGNKYGGKQYVSMAYFRSKTSLF